MDIKIINISDKNYPFLLKQIPDPPEILYVKGELPEGPMLAVVGTRKMTPYGREVTAKLTAGLVEAGFAIVSGMALGVDTVAHQTALAAGGQTVAVLGAGVDIIYPRENKNLYGNIFGHGAIISEVPPGKMVERKLFPARNRIISGLSLGVLVTEGAIDSGSLITARAALDQGREVFAVPGSAGADYLIDQGAKSITDVSDILSELRL